MSENPIDRKVNHTKNILATSVTVWKTLKFLAWCVFLLGVYCSVVFFAFVLIDSKKAARDLWEGLAVLGIGLLCLFVGKIFIAYTKTRIAALRKSE